MSAAFYSKKTPESYALALMDSMFSDEDMRNHLFIKKRNSRSTKDALDQDKVKKVFSKFHINVKYCIIVNMVLLHYRAITRKIWKRTGEKVIVEKCNQKCRDKQKAGISVKSEELADNYLPQD